MSLLALPFELRTIIYDLVFVDPSTPHLRVCRPSERFSYDDDQEGTRKNVARLRRTHRRSRSSTKALLTQRPRNPYHTCTRMSLLLVCRQLNEEASAVYYGRSIWEVGFHGRNPTVPVFREFLDIVGERNRDHIRTVVVLSRFGYKHLWEGPTRNWAKELYRCKNLRTILVSMVHSWAHTTQATKRDWATATLTAWKQYIGSLQSIAVADLDTSIDYLPGMSPKIKCIGKTCFYTSPESWPT